MRENLKGLLKTSGLNSAVEKGRGVNSEKLIGLHHYCRQLGAPVAHGKESVFLELTLYFRKSR
jgi:hypothetical protein